MQPWSKYLCCFRIIRLYQFKRVLSHLLLRVFKKLLYGVACYDNHARVASTVCQHLHTSGLQLHVPTWLSSKCCLLLLTT